MLYRSVSKKYFAWLYHHVGNFKRGILLCLLLSILAVASSLLFVEVTKIFMEAVERGENFSLLLLVISLTTLKACNIFCTELDLFARKAIVADEQRAVVEIFQRIVRRQCFLRRTSTFGRFSEQTNDRCFQRVQLLDGNDSGVDLRGVAIRGDLHLPCVNRAFADVGDSFDYVRQHNVRTLIRKKIIADFQRDKNLRQQRTPIYARTHSTSRTNCHVGENRIHLEPTESTSDRAVRKAYRRRKIKRLGYVFDRRRIEFQLHRHFGLGHLRHTKRNFYLRRIDCFPATGGANPNSVYSIQS